MIVYGDKEEPVPDMGAVAKVLYASICGTDLRSYRFGNAKLNFQTTIGHEACMAIAIESIAPEITGFNAGDR